MTTTDDYSAGWDTTGSIQGEGAVKGSIETVGDRDWFAITSKAQRWYRIDVEGHDDGSGALKKPAHVAIYAPNGRFATLETTIFPGQC